MNAVVKRCHLTVLPLCLSLFLSRILACHLKNVGILLGRPPSFYDYKNVDFARFFFFQHTVFLLHGTYWAVLHNAYVNSDREMKAATLSICLVFQTKAMKDVLNCVIQFDMKRWSLIG